MPRCDWGQREGQSPGLGWAEPWAGVGTAVLSSASAGGGKDGMEGAAAPRGEQSPRAGSAPAAWEEPLLAGNHHTLLPLLTLVHT